jgi:hypothetical protein
MDRSQSGSDNNSQNEASQISGFDWMDNSDLDCECHNSLESSHHNASEEFKFYLNNGRGYGQLRRIEIDGQLLETP